MSALLHAVPISYLVLSTPKATVPEPISQLDLVDSIPPAGPMVSRETKSEARKTSARKRSTALGNILLGVKSVRNFESNSTSDIIASGVDLDGDDRFPADPMSGVKDFAQGWSGAVQYGNLMGLEFTLESLGFFQALHARIEGHLVYPDDFSRQRITGKVRIEAELARDGRLIRFISSQADDRLLQTY